MTLPENGLVKFYASWCGPCKAISPVLKKVASENQVDLVEVDIESNPELAQQFDVRSVPMVVAIKDGVPVKSTVGAFSEDFYANLVTDSLK